MLKTMICGAEVSTVMVFALLQVRQRDKETREVRIEERRYDKAGQDVVMSSWEEKGLVASGDSIGTLNDVSTSSLQAGFGSSYVTDDSDSDNPYAWAQRLREIPDKVAASIYVLFCTTHSSMRLLSLANVG